MITQAGRDAWGSVVAVSYARMRARVEESSTALGISAGALRTLMLLEPGQGMTMGELAERWGCDASYMTSLADDLEESGLVRREPKPSDRRAKLLVITSEGIEARKRAHEIFMQPPPELEALNATEQRQLRDLLAKVAAAVDPALAPRPLAPR